MKIKNMKQVKEYMEDMNMKRLFRRNQIIITTLTVMVAAAGYLNYAGKKDLVNGSTVHEAGVMGISDEDILVENQAVSPIGQSRFQEISSLNQDPLDLDAVSDADGAQAVVDPGTDARTLVQAGNNAAVEEATQAADAGQTADMGQTAQAGTDDSAQIGPEDPGEAVLTSGTNVADYIVNVQFSREQIRAKNEEILMTLINSTSIGEVAKQQAIQDMTKLIGVSEKENVAETLLMAKGFPDPVVSITQDKIDVVINAPSITDPQRAQIKDIIKRRAEAGADQIIITPPNMVE